MKATIWAEMLCDFLLNKAPRTRNYYILQGLIDPVKSDILYAYTSLLRIFLINLVSFLGERTYK